MSQVIPPHEDLVRRLAYGYNHYVWQRSVTYDSIEWEVWRRISTS